MRAIFAFLMFFGIFIIIFQISMGNLFLSLLGIPIFALGYLVEKRIGKIKIIRKNSILLALGKKEIELDRDSIASISKFVRFTLTQRFWIKISLSKGRSPLLNCFFFMNEPQHNFIDRFLSMGLKLKNFP